MSRVFAKLPWSKESRLKSVIKNFVENIIREKFQPAGQQKTTLLEQFKNTNKYNGKIYKDEEVIRKLINETYSDFKDEESSDEITEQKIRDELSDELWVARNSQSPEDKPKADEKKGGKKRKSRKQKKSKRKSHKARKSHKRRR